MIFALTGSTGFIGSDVVARLLKAGHSAAHIICLVRRIPKAESSLLWRRLKDYGLESEFTKLHFHICDFEKPDELRISLERLEQYPDVIIHMAAVIHASNSEIETQRKLNVDATLALAQWGRGKIKHFVFLSSAVAWGISLRCKIRRESDFDKWHPINDDFSYFATKREAHKALLAMAKDLRISLLCPSIVHGSLESEKNSRPHLKKLREGKLKLAPGGGNNIVPLERVSQAIVECSRSPHGTSPFVQLLVSENHLYGEYFQRYVNIARGPQAQKIRRLPFWSGWLALALFKATRSFGWRIAFIESLLQSSFFIYVESERPLPPAPSLDEALRNSLK